jgi:hypothetical protein
MRKERSEHEKMRPTYESRLILIIIIIIIIIIIKKTSPNYTTYVLESLEY